MKLRTFVLSITLSILLAVTLINAGAGDYYDEPGVRLLNQPLNEYRARRQKLMESIKDGVVVILGSVEESGGVEARYRQNNWMAYLTGVRTPGSALVLAPHGLPSQGGARELVFIPPRNPATERWTGVQLEPSPETARAFGVERVLSAKNVLTDLWPVLKEASALPAFRKDEGNSSMKLYTIAANAPRSGRVREYLFTQAVKEALPGIQIVPVSPIVAEMRKIKSEAELVLLQKAIDITIDAHLEIARQLKPGMYEFEVQAILESVFTRNGSERPGFPSIVGSGFNSTILHYNENRKTIEAGDLVVCDIGAEYSLYTADVTRTYPATGKFSARQREIYQLVLDAQTAAARQWKPGMTLDALEKIAKAVLRSSPLRAKDTDGREYTMDHFFIHGLGHYFGMDVHDVGDYKRPLGPGQVFTIEPGIYIQTEKIGVRIEDDYVITQDNQVKKMTDRLPSTPDDIERVMANKHPPKAR